MNEVYRAVGNRCAVSFESLGLPFCYEEFLQIIGDFGFKVMNVDIVKLARSCVGVSCYRRGCDFRLAPKVVDCSAFIKWVYAQKGVWLPRLSVEQYHYCSVAVALDDVRVGDLLFTEGDFGFSWDSALPRVGHVGLVSEVGTVIHASGRRSGVVEVSVESFLADGNFVGIRRVIVDSDVITVEVPAGFFIEWSHSFRFLILQNTWH